MIIELIIGFIFLYFGLRIHKHYEIYIFINKTIEQIRDYRDYRIYKYPLDLDYKDIKELENIEKNFYKDVHKILAGVKYFNMDDSTILDLRKFLNNLVLAITRLKSVEKSREYLENEIIAMKKRGKVGETYIIQGDKKTRIDDNFDLKVKMEYHDSLSEGIDDMRELMLSSTDRKNNRYTKKLDDIECRAENLKIKNIIKNIIIKFFKKYKNSNLFV